MAQMDKITVVIADTLASVRNRYCELLSDITNIAIVAEAANSKDAVAIIARHIPDIALIDTALPLLGGVETSRRIHLMEHATKIILFTDDFEKEKRLEDIIDIGVMGYVLKDIAKDELVHTIQSVHKGAPVFHPMIKRRFANLIRNTPHAHDGLTSRELDILKEIARGKSNRAIASALNLTEGTVKGYVSLVLSKLGVKDRTQAALYTVRHGLDI